MNCPACQTSNRENARFCRFCGIGFLPRCPFCNADIPIPSAFCDQCGRQISASGATRHGDFASPTPSLTTTQPINRFTDHRSPISNLQALITPDLAAKLHTARAERAMEGERRVVTMLFCDVKGSTEAASRLDPEEWAGIINGAFACMISPVYHYEGTVARLMGDGILAFFGAPIAHEDDPQRGVLAGLEIIEAFKSYQEKVSGEWQLEIDARVGINTGLVVVGAVGSDLQMEYSALGDAINIAARMEQTARPGTVQVGEDTYKLVAPLFDWEDLGEITVKGKVDPVHTYRPIRPKTRTGLSGPGRLRGIEGLESPTIGRDHELTLLRSAVENLAQHGVGSLVFLTGEAGMGKSRLLQEVKVESSRWQNQPSTFPFPSLNWYEVAPLSFEASQPYALFRNFVRQITGVSEMDAAETARPKLAALAERLPVEVRGGVTGAFAWVLGVLSGEPPDGESFKRQLFATAREVVRVQFSKNPGVIVLDDLHWADPASVEIFNHLVPLMETFPILFLCATRPEREAPIWHVKTTLAEEYPHRFVEIPVQPLSTEDSNALVDHLLAIAELPPRVRAMILDKSEGNPFFLEEIIRALIDEGALVREKDAPDGQMHWHIVEDEMSTLIIPDNLQTLLAARLDRLAEDTRRVLQMASVIGRTFYYRVLQNITDTLNGLDGQLSTLQRLNMVVEAARLPELEYAFRHTLVQETVYHSILRKQRREFHRRVGEAMETLFATRLDDYAPVLAMHFERAGEDARAFEYFIRAGDVAYRLHAVKEAISHYGRGLDLLKQVGEKSSETSGIRLSSDTLSPDTLEHLCLRLGRALEMDGQYEEALKHYVELEMFAQAHQTRQLELAALCARMTVHAAPTDQFDREQVETLSQKALALAEELEDHETEAKIYWNLMNMCGFSGEMERGYMYGTRSLEIARRYNLHEQLAYTLNDFQRMKMMANQIEDAREMVEEAQQLWLELDNQAMYIDSLVSAALLYIVIGDYAKVEHLCLKALKLSQDIGNLWGQSYSYYTLGFLYTEQSRFTQALDVMHHARRLAEPAGFVMPLIDCNTYTGLIYGYLGDFERGKAFALAGLQNARERIPAMQPGPLSVLAILEYWAGNPAAMETWLGDTDPAPEIHSFTGFERFIAEGYRLTAKGEYQELIQLTSIVLPKVQAFGALVFLAEIYRLNGNAMLTLHRLDEARQFLEKARAAAAHSPHRQVDIHITFSQLEMASGNPAAAEAHIVEARKNIEIVLQNIPEPQLQTTYLARPKIRAILHPDSL